MRASEFRKVLRSLLRLSHGACNALFVAEGEQGESRERYLRGATRLLDRGIAAIGAWLANVRPAAVGGGYAGLEQHGQLRLPFYHADGSEYREGAMNCATRGDAGWFAPLIPIGAALVALAFAGLGHVSDVLNGRAQAWPPSAWDAVVPFALRTGLVLVLAGVAFWALARVCGPRRERDSCGFTSIELLVVASIICMLSGLLAPAFGLAREKARQAVCASNVRQLAVGLGMYAEDWDGMLPAPVTAYVGPSGFQIRSWQDTLGLQKLRCPSQSKGFHYGYNVLLSPTRGGRMSEDSRVPLCADANLMFRPAPRASWEYWLQVTTAHAYDAANVAYCDGHVKSIPRAWEVM